MQWGQVWDNRLKIITKMNQPINITKKKNEQTNTKSYNNPIWSWAGQARARFTGKESRVPAIHKPYLVNHAVPLWAESEHKGEENLIPWYSILIRYKVVIISKKDGVSYLLSFKARREGHILLKPHFHWSDGLKCYHSLLSLKGYSSLQTFLLKHSTLTQEWNHSSQSSS